ncbi:hypothetical protein NPS70_05395 [Streptomyces sp. C10-9-1]|uniref:hypothetical protein n=1 Tax=Streptomyces sp. C10-9-1 TaxID=1859285 RepID=UPI0021138160|nr:hypothetical protein [Streptomyces sp. C10-9-1]MCQ6552631.1 hypothetical protein [Streptomyces sp. C10-9-1]
MRTRPFTWVSALAGLTLTLLLVLVPTASAADPDLSDAAAALKQGPVYVHPSMAEELTPGEAAVLADRIESADKPLFVAVLPATEEFAPDGLLEELRARTGIAGIYAVRLGEGFNAAADSVVMPGAEVARLSDAVKVGGPVDAATQLDNFVGQALPEARGTAPATWDSGAQPVGPGGSGAGALIALGVLAAAAGTAVLTVRTTRRRRKVAEDRAALEKLRVVVDEDITAYGEALDRLDFHPGEKGADDTMRADYAHALDAYETAKDRMSAAERPADVRPVTEALQDGRFSLAVLAARREGSPLPERRAPCFFDPRHGPSVADVAWAPTAGTEREVPVCAADRARIADGRDPDARTVETESGRRPYWEAGPAYGPWAGGYFGGGILPGLLMGTMLGHMLAAPAYAADYGGGEFGAGEAGADGAGDFGGDFGSSDFGSGGWGGGDWGGGGGFGGFDGGGF